MLVLELFIGLGAVGGGVGPILTNGMEMPHDWLTDTPFDSYRVPGIILALAVGGGNLTAAWMLWRRRPLTPAAPLAGGCIPLGWMSVQLALIGYRGCPQPVYVGFGVVVVGLSWWLHRTATDFHGSTGDMSGTR